MSLPVLNLSTNPVLFADQLRKACHNIGFFLLEHDIPEAICNQALSETRHFFARPLAEKKTISYEDSPAFRGYMPLGVENTEGRVDGREQIEYAAEYLHEQQILERSLHRPFYHRLRSTNPWPNAVQPSLQPAISEYVRGVLEVADRLRDAMCVALQVDSDEIAPLFGQYDGEEPSFWSMKLVSYPPAHNGASTGDSMQGVGAHCDSNFLTLICQDPQSSGLQVQNVQGGWIDVPPTGPNTLICNIGELAQVWSGGYFLATPHKVLRNASSDRSRISLPVFYNPKLDSEMEPINTDGLRWERTQEMQWQRTHNTLINSVGENSFKSLARSHPAVFQRHHSDLTLREDGTIVERL
ncbi:hypothetical protein ACHAXT_000630 [Thalassiosira profunda]